MLLSTFMPLAAINQYCEELGIMPLLLDSLEFISPLDSPVLSVDINRGLWQVMLGLAHQEQKHVCILFKDDCQHELRQEIKLSYFLK